MWFSYLGLNLSCPAALLHMTHATPVAKAAAPKYVTTANVHLRKGPGTKYSVILTIPKGKRIPYLKKNGSWIQTKYKGKTGYVSSQYIKKQAKAHQLHMLLLPLKRQVRM